MSIIVAVLSMVAIFYYADRKGVFDDNSNHMLHTHLTMGAVVFSVAFIQGAGNFFAIVGFCFNVTYYTMYKQTPQHEYNRFGIWLPGFLFILSVIYETIVYDFPVLFSIYTGVICAVGFQLWREEQADKDHEKTA